MKKIVWLILGLLLMVSSAFAEETFITIELQKWNMTGIYTGRHVGIKTLVDTNGFEWKNVLKNGYSFMVSDDIIKWYESSKCKYVIATLNTKNWTLKVSANYLYKLGYDIGFDVDIENHTITTKVLYTLKNAQGYFFFKIDDDVFYVNNKISQDDISYVDATLKDAIVNLIKSTIPEEVLTSVGYTSGYYTKSEPKENEYIFCLYKDINKDMKSGNDINDILDDAGKKLFLISSTTYNTDPQFINFMQQH